MHSDAFWSSAGGRAKIKSPLEFLVSAVRATGGRTDMTPAPRPTARTPSGNHSSSTSRPPVTPNARIDWVNSGALLARMNFAIALAANRVPGVVIDLDDVVPITPDQPALVTQVDRAILRGRMSSRTRDAIVQALAGITDPGEARARAVGMAIGGPEFQQQ